MAKKRVDVEIGSKSKVAAGLKQARFAIKKFARSAGAMLKKLTTSTIALGAATVALGVKSVKAFFVQESAEKALAEAMLAHGDAIDELLPKHKALAAAIQDETGIADEATLATMAKLRTLGVTNDEMERAVKLTLALSKTGMREKTAFRAAADAINGNTTALTTYIPELRQATTDSEKIAVVNDLMTRGYKQLTGELDTNAGRWTELKGRIGDFMEQIGRAIVENASFQDVLKKVSARIKELTNSGKIDEWATKAVAAIKSLASGLSRFITIAKEIIALRFQLMWIAIAAAMGKVLIATASLITGFGGLSVAAHAAAAAIIRLKIAALSYFGLGVAAVFAASALAVAKFSKTLWESHKATMALIKSSKELKAMENKMQEKYGTRNASTLRRVRQTMKSGTEEEKETVERLFPELAAAWKKHSKTSTKPPPVMDKPGLTGSASGAAIMKTGGLSQATSMLSAGDMFTMMQAGTGAKRESELSELQGINSKLEKLIEVSGGVE